MNMIDQIDSETIKGHAPSYIVGDDVRVHVKIKDGDKVRIQVFEGTVIAMSGGGASATFTVRKTSFGVGVERIFPVHSPILDKVEVKTRHSVRRAKLYYLRERSGKSARLKDAPYTKAVKASPNT
ncbi:MAG: 50S ribosomal protein L19 [Myxococcota bacterium]